LHDISIHGRSNEVTKLVAARAFNENLLRQ
jgi:hypothetical protein